MSFLSFAGKKQLFITKEQFLPGQQEWSISVGQKEPEHPHIKEEEEELFIEQERVDITVVTVKSEGFHQGQVQETTENHGAGTSCPHGFEAGNGNQTEHWSQTGTETFKHNNMKCRLT